MSSATLSAVSTAILDLALLGAIALQFRGGAPTPRRRRALLVLVSVCAVVGGGFAIAALLSAAPLGILVDPE